MTYVWKTSHAARRSSLAALAARRATAPRPATPARPALAVRPATAARRAVAARAVRAALPSSSLAASVSRHAPPASALPPSPPRGRAACVPSHPPARPAARWVGGCRADEGPPTYFTQPDVAAGPGVAMVRRIVYTDAPCLVLHSCSCCSERGSKAHLVLYLNQKW